MKFNDIELPADLQDKDKGCQIIRDNAEIIFKLDEEYGKIRVSGWPGGPNVLAFIPEEFRENWDKEFNWFIRANNLFDEVYKSSSGEGHYKYNIIRGDWKHNFAEHYIADGSLLISTPSHLALTSALWPDREPEQRAGPISVPPHSTSSPRLGRAAQDRLINTMYNERCAQGHTTSSNESENNYCNSVLESFPLSPAREPPNNFSVDWRPRDKCHFWPC